MTKEEHDLLRSMMEAPRAVLMARYRARAALLPFVIASMAVSKSQRFLYAYGSPGWANIVDIRGASDIVGGVALFIGTGAVSHGGEMVEGGIVVQRIEAFNDVSRDMETAREGLRRPTRRKGART